MSLEDCLVAAPQDSQTDAIARNRIATRRLLAALIEHHGQKSQPEAIEVPIIAEATTAEPIEVCVLPIPEPVLTIDGIKRVVCRHYGVSNTDLISPRREARITWPRQMAMYLCREFTTRSLPEIARRFGNRDHTTAIHAVRKVRDMIKTDVTVAAEVSNFREYLSA